MRPRVRGLGPEPVLLGSRDGKWCVGHSKPADRAIESRYESERRAITSLRKQLGTHTEIGVSLGGASTSWTFTSATDSCPEPNSGLKNNLTGTLCRAPRARGRALSCAYLLLWRGSGIYRVGIGQQLIFEELRSFLKTRQQGRTKRVKSSISWV